MNHPTQTRRYPLWAMLLPLAVLLLAGVPLLVYATGGFFGYFLGVIAFFVLLGAIHWVVWGRSLHEDVAEEREEEAARRREQGEDWPATDPYGVRK